MVWDAGKADAQAATEALHKKRERAGAEGRLTVVAALKYGL
jgi:hypothetical protein